MFKCPLSRDIGLESLKKFIESSRSFPIFEFCVRGVAFPSYFNIFKQWKTKLLFRQLL